MKIAAAQIDVSDMNIELNIKKHIFYIDRAIESGVRLVIFPEMSITGYVREKAKELALTVNDSSMDVFREKAKTGNIMIAVGAPAEVDNQLCIGTFIFHPNGNTSLYTKQFLHSGEEEYFSPNSNYNPIIEIDSHRISFAICYDINNPIHTANACTSGATLYAASLFFTPNGIEEAHTLLSEAAGKYSMNIIMSNYIGTSYNYNGAGKSASWNKRGQLIGSCDDNTECLLIASI